MLEQVTFPLDHFGTVAAPTFAQLLTQGGDKRKRRGAYNLLVYHCRKFKLIPLEAKVLYIGQVTDSNGQTVYTVLFQMPLKLELPKVQAPADVKEPAYASGNE